MTTAAAGAAVTRPADDRWRQHARRLERARLQGRRPPGEPVQQPGELAYGPDGKVYVADFDNSKIRVVDMDGNAIDGDREGQASRGRSASRSSATRSTSRPTATRKATAARRPDVGHDLEGRHHCEDGDAGRDSASVVRAASRRCSDGRLAVADYEHHVIQILDPASGNTSRRSRARGTSKGFADGVERGAVLDAVCAACSVTTASSSSPTSTTTASRSSRIDGTVATLARQRSAGFADGAMAGAKFNHPQGIVEGV